MNSEVQPKSINELTLCLKASLEQVGREAGFESEMKKDFRQLVARFICTAKKDEVERCTRFVLRSEGCTYQGEGESCWEVQRS